MGRKANPHKKPVSNKVRARMCRQRKKLKSSNRRIEQQICLNMATQSVCFQDENNLNRNSDLKIKIRDWANVHRISKRAIDDLLSALISSGIDSVPRNHRTLQQTPTNVIISDVSGGKYWYNGLAKSIKQIFSSLDKNIRISLNFNVDGLPLYKSSPIAFYPILANIHGLYQFTTNHNSFDTFEL